MDVKSIIKQKGFTIDEVAKTIGISRVTLSQNIARNPTIATLRRIADTIGCNMADFFADEIKGAQTQNCPHCGKPVHITLEK